MNRISSEKWWLRSNDDGDVAFPARFLPSPPRETLVGGEKSSDSSCGTHVRRIKSGRKLWRWRRRRWGGSSPAGPHVAGNKGANLPAAREWLNSLTLQRARDETRHGPHSRSLGAREFPVNRSRPTRPSFPCWQGASNVNISPTATVSFLCDRTRERAESKCTELPNWDEYEKRDGTSSERESNGNSPGAAIAKIGSLP